MVSDACQVLSSSWVTGGRALSSAGEEREGKSRCGSQSVLLWRTSSSSGVSLDCDLPIAATGRETRSPINLN